MRLRVFLALAGLAVISVLGGALSCDYFLQGTYTGLCDEPSTLYWIDGGDPEKRRMAQCQVTGNICCRHKDLMSGGMTTDLRTYCLNYWECYLGTKVGDPCYGDVDCNTGLQCADGEVHSRKVGKCVCPDMGVGCPAPLGGSYCCKAGSMCGVGDCMPPVPVDLAAPAKPDLSISPPDLRRD